MARASIRLTAATTPSGKSSSASGGLIATMNAPCALLIDDPAMFRAGLRQVIKVAIPDLDIFEAGSLDEALACPSSNVTVVLLDNKLNGLSGIEGIALIRRKWPLVKKMPDTASIGGAWPATPRAFEQTDCSPPARIYFPRSSDQGSAGVLHLLFECHHKELARPHQDDRDRHTHQPV